MASRPLGLLAYKYATAAIAPAVPLLLRQRASRGKEDAARMKERLGFAGRPRPEGPLIWIHGASVGETMSALALVDALTGTGVHVLVTSGTVTAAHIMAGRLPQGAIHQFAPVDTPPAIARFLEHWKPQIGLFVDSELWPNMILSARERGIRLALINARMSERSFAGWQHAPKSASALLNAFDACLAQDDEIANRLRALGAQDVQVSGNLKADAPPLPADPTELQALRSAVGARPVLLAASTHPGEDETVLPAHDKLRAAFPALLTILVPRHPRRGQEIEMLCGTRKCARRSTGGTIAADTAVYIADTIGELGLFYRLAPFAFMGGSLIPHGGQNPLEPARLDCAVMAGEHTENFKTAYQAIFTAQGGGRVHGCADIAATAQRLLTDPDLLRHWREGASRAAGELGGAVQKTLAVVAQMLASHAAA